MQVFGTFSILINHQINLFGTQVTIGGIITAMFLITLVGMIMEAIFGGKSND